MSLGYLWALPTTAIGGLIALLSFSKPYRIQAGAVLCVSGTWFDLILRGLHVAAITVGGVIFTREKVSPFGTLIRHELVHFAQAKRWGPFFIPAYYGASLWVWLRGKHPYADNPFEVEASKLLP